MEFKRLLLKKILMPGLFVMLVIGVIILRFLPKIDSSISEDSQSSGPIESNQDILVKTNFPDESILNISQDEDMAIQQQLDRDRQEQKQTKYLKNKLEQTNLELEQEKALAEINKLKMDNMGGYKDPGIDGQKILPEVKVEYIGGDSIKKEAIISIAGVNFQVKEKSSPTDSIQVLTISDSSVTLHFSAPQELTKTIEYRPE